MKATIQQARQIMRSIAELPLLHAVHYNSWLRDKAYRERSAISAGYPAVFEIEPTNLCAMSCTHCPRPTGLRRDGMHMSPELMTLIAGHIRLYAQNLYAATGDQMLAVNFMHYGEPALSPHYRDGVRLLKRLGVHVVSSSTSSEFSERAARAAVEAGLDELWLIFDGMDDATFQRMRGPRASFEEGLERLRFLQQLKAEAGATVPDIVAVMVRHAWNRHQWGRFEAFFGAWQGVRHYLAHFSTFNGRAPLLDQLRQLMDDPATQEEQIRVAALNAHVCRYPWHSVCVLADGRVVPCCRDLNGDLCLGDLKTQSLAEIWNGEAIRELRRRFAANDRNNPLCLACREASLEIGLPDELAPEEEQELLGMAPDLHKAISG